MTAAVINADCLAVLRAMPDNSIDAIVTDPPYGLSNIKPERITEAITAWATGDRERVPDGKGFMGKAWDSFVPPPAVWDECLRVLKPGGHLVAFAGSRTHDLMGLSIRMAGFEIRDGLAWLYGSGFPKSMDVSKAIDKLDAAAERRSRALEFTAWIRECGLTAGQINKATGTNMGGHFTTAAAQPAVATADLFDMLRPLLPEVPARIEELVAERTVESQNFKAREVVGKRIAHDATKTTLGFTGPTYGGTGATREIELTTAHTPEAQQWEGWGTAIKPAFEPVTLARKPLEGTVAANVLKWGTGALNIDGCRIGMSDADAAAINAKHAGMDEDSYQRPAGTSLNLSVNPMPLQKAHAHDAGRWPANVVLDEDQAAALDEQAEGASRFFLVCEGDTMDACGNASTAEPSSSQQSARGDSAPSDAATSASLVDNSSSHSTEPSMSATATESRPRSASDTQAILSTAPRCSPESRQPRHTPTSSPARNAEPSEPTGTTTTTQSRSKSAGSAAPATFSTTPKQAERGVRDLPLDALTSRFIYCAKASSKERPEVDGVKHPTVKPLSLMRWLVRLVTPPGGVVLDPFAGSGTTIEAAAIEGFSCTGIELDPNYAELCRVRIKRADDAQRDLFGETS